MDVNKTQQAAKEFLRKGLPLHILVCNAGIMVVPFELSADGIESTFAVNHIGYVLFFLLGCGKKMDTTERKMEKRGGMCSQETVNASRSQMVSLISFLC